MVMAMPDKEDGDIIRKWDLHRITATLIVEPWGAFAFIKNLKIKNLLRNIFLMLVFINWITLNLQCDLKH